MNKLPPSRWRRSPTKRRNQLNSENTKTISPKSQSVRRSDVESMTPRTLSTQRIAKDDGCSFDSFVDNTPTRYPMPESCDLLKFSPDQNKEDIHYQLDPVEGYLSQLLQRELISSGQKQSTELTNIYSQNETSLDDVKSKRIARISKEERCDSVPPSHGRSSPTRRSKKNCKNGSKTNWPAPQHAYKSGHEALSPDTVTTKRGAKDDERSFHSFTENAAQRCPRSESCGPLKTVPGQNKDQVQYPVNSVEGYLEKLLQRELDTSVQKQKAELINIISQNKTCLEDGRGKRVPGTSEDTKYVSAPSSSVNNLRCGSVPISCINDLECGSVPSSCIISSVRSIERPSTPVDRRRFPRDDEHSYNIPAFRKSTKSSSNKVDARPPQHPHGTISRPVSPLKLLENDVKVDGRGCNMKRSESLPKSMINLLKSPRSPIPENSLRHGFDQKSFENLKSSSPARHWSTLSSRQETFSQAFLRARRESSQNKKFIKYSPPFFPKSSSSNYNRVSHQANLHCLRDESNSNSFESHNQGTNKTRYAQSDVSLSQQNIPNHRRSRSCEAVVERSMFREDELKKDLLRPSPLLVHDDIFLSPEMKPLQPTLSNVPTKSTSSPKYSVTIPDIFSTFWSYPIAITDGTSSNLILNPKLVNSFSQLSNKPQSYPSPVTQLSSYTSTCVFQT